MSGFTSIGGTTVGHSAAYTGLTTALTSAYVAGSQRQQMALWVDTPAVVGSLPFKGHLSAIYIKVDTIASGATQITFRLTRDANGDNTIIGDTTATISTGITTATEGAITAKIDIDYVNSNDTLWCHMKTNAGTCNVKSIELFWSV